MSHVFCRTASDRSGSLSVWNKVEQHGYVVERIVEGWTKNICDYGILCLNCVQQISFPLRIEHIKVLNITALNSEKHRESDCSSELRLYVRCLLSDLCKRRFQREGYIDLNSSLLYDHPCICKHRKEDCIQVSIQLTPAGNPFIYSNAAQLLLQMSIKLILLRREASYADQEGCCIGDCWLDLYPRQKQLRS